MTLLKRTQSLATRAKQRREQDAREEVAKAVRERTRNLERHLEQLEAARARVAALGGAGHPRSEWPAPPVAAFGAYDPEGGAPLSVESTRQAEWKKFVLALERFVKKVEGAVADDVKQAKQSALEGISSEELRGYLEDPSTESEARKLLENFEMFQQRRWETLSGADLTTVLQPAGALRESVVRLRETGASEELRKFVALTRKDGAPLDALTDALRAELKRRKLLGRLRLILK